MSELDWNPAAGRLSVRHPLLRSGLLNLPLIGIWGQKSWVCRERLYLQAPAAPTPRLDNQTRPQTLLECSLGEAKPPPVQATGGTRSVPRACLLAWPSQRASPWLTAPQQCSSWGLAQAGLQSCKAHLLWWLPKPRRDHRNRGHDRGSTGTRVVWCFPIQRRDPGGHPKVPHLPTSGLFGGRGRGQVSCVPMKERRSSPLLHPQVKALREGGLRRRWPLGPGRSSSLGAEQGRGHPRTATARAPGCPSSLISVTNCPNAHASSVPTVLTLAHVTSQLYTEVCLGALPLESLPEPALQ